MTFVILSVLFVLAVGGIRAQCVGHAVTMCRVTGGRWSGAGGASGRHRGQSAAQLPVSASPNEFKVKQVSVLT